MITTHTLTAIPKQVTLLTSLGFDLSVWESTYCSTSSSLTNMQFPCSGSAGMLKKGSFNDSKDITFDSMPYKLVALLVPELFPELRFLTRPKLPSKETIISPSVWNRNINDDYDSASYLVPSYEMVKCNLCIVIFQLTFRIISNLWTGRAYCTIVRETLPLVVVVAKLWNRFPH